LAIFIFTAAFAVPLLGVGCSDVAIANDVLS
jgi:hypothetical protein